MPSPAERKVLSQLGARLRHARTTAGLSAEDLAHRSGLDRTYVTSVERGERNVGVINLVRLASALDIDPADLVSGLRVGRKRSQPG